MRVVAKNIYVVIIGVIPFITNQMIMLGSETNYHFTVDLGLFNVSGEILAPIIGLGYPLLSFWMLDELFKWKRDDLKPITRAASIILPLLPWICVGILGFGVSNAHLHFRSLIHVLVSLPIALLAIVILSFADNYSSPAAVVNNDTTQTDRGTSKIQ